MVSHIPARKVTSLNCRINRPYRMLRTDCLERQDLPCTSLAHREPERFIFVIVEIIMMIIVTILYDYSYNCYYGVQAQHSSG